MTRELDIILDDLRDKRVIQLLEEHLKQMRSLSPACSVHALDVDALKGPKITFYTGWTGQQLSGCAALHELNEVHGEIKSMRTVSHSLRRGVAGRMLAHLIEESRLRGYQRLSLETGSQPGFQPARRFYERHGFRVTDPFANYTHDLNSVYYTLDLQS